MIEGGFKLSILSVFWSVNYWWELNKTLRYQISIRDLNYLYVIFMVYIKLNLSDSVD